MGLSIAIQAGGASTRMGQDKALLPFLGKPLIQHILERLSGVTDDILIITNRPDSYRFLNVPLASDILPGNGPLGGLYTALTIIQAPFVALVACDMPFADAVLLMKGYEILTHSQYDVFIPQVRHRLEPLHAVYRRQTCLPIVQAALAAGKRQMIAWLNKVKTYHFVIGEEADSSRFRHAFLNVNTPAEFCRAEKLAIMFKENLSDLQME